MGSWLLSPTGEATKDKTMLERLAGEGKSIPNTSKNQKGVLLNVQLVRGICSMTQLDHFRLPGSLKVTELNASRTFAAGVRDFYNLVIYSLLTLISL